MRTLGMTFATPSQEVTQDLKPAADEGALKPGSVHLKMPQAAKLFDFGPHKLDNYIFTKTLPPTTRQHGIKEGTLVSLKPQTSCYEDDEDDEVRIIDPEAPKDRKRKKTKKATEMVEETIGVIKHTVSTRTLLGMTKGPGGEVMASVQLGLVLQGDDVKDFYLGTNGPWQSEEVVHVTDISDPDDDGNRFATANLKLILDMDRLLQEPLRIDQVGVVCGATVLDVEKSIYSAGSKKKTTWIKLSTSNLRVVLYVCEVLKEWCFALTGIKINYSIVGETNCSKSSTIAALVQAYQAITIAVGEAYGTGKADGYPMGLEGRRVEDILVQILDTAGFSGMDYERTEDKATGKVKYVVKAVQAADAEAPDPRRPIIPRIKIFLEYVSVNGIIRGINLGVSPFDELIDAFKTKTFRGKPVKMEPTDIIRLNINARTLIDGDMDLFKLIIAGEIKPPERSAMSLAKRAGRELVAEIAVTRLEQLFDEVGHCTVEWMLETLVQRNCGDYKRRGRKGPGVDIGAMVKLFESYISGMLGGIKVTAISSKISGKVPTEDELVKFGSLNIVMFVDLVRALHRKRVRTVDAIRRDENDMRFEELVEKGTDWKVVETGFKEHYNGLTVDKAYRLWGHKEEEDEEMDEEVSVVLPVGYKFINAVAQFSRYTWTGTASELYTTYENYKTPGYKASASSMPPPPPPASGGAAALCKHGSLECISIGTAPVFCTATVKEEKGVEEEARCKYGVAKCLSIGTGRGRCPACKKAHLKEKNEERKLKRRKEAEAKGEETESEEEGEEEEDDE